MTKSVPYKNTSVYLCRTCTWYQRSDLEVVYLCLLLYTQPEPELDQFIRRKHVFEGYGNAREATIDSDYRAIYVFCLQKRKSGIPTTASPLHLRTAQSDVHASPATEPLARVAPPRARVIAADRARAEHTVLHQRVVTWG